MSHTLEKSLDKSLDALIELAAEVQVFLTGCGLCERVIFKVQLGLEEAIRNLIEHATGSATNRIQVRIDVGHDQVAIVLEDDGLPFDPRSAPPFDRSRPLEEREPRGMGLQLLRTLIDEIHYERLDSRNRLRLVVASPSVDPFI
jgi:serine/threonine-protein kinase RsbW